MAILREPYRQIHPRRSGMVTKIIMNYNLHNHVTEFPIKLLYINNRGLFWP